jgi:uncharacterized protein (DUF433 family)
VPHRNPLDVPNYGYQEAVRYLHIPNSTLHYWLRPSLGLIRREHPRLLSFNNLMELFVLKGLETIHGVELKQIRRAVDYLRKTDEVDHPLADVELRTDGAYVFVWDKGEYTNISLMGQKGIGPILETYLRRVERDWIKGSAALYPFTRRQQMSVKADQPKVVVMNPAVCSGKPVLIGSRITIAVLASRHLGGDSYDALADSYGRSVGEIKEAVDWQLGKAA